MNKSLKQDSPSNNVGCKKVLRKLKKAMCSSRCLYMVKFVEWLGDRLMAFGVFIRMNGYNWYLSIMGNSCISGNCCLWPSHCSKTLCLLVSVIKKSKKARCTGKYRYGEVSWTTWQPMDTVFESTSSWMGLTSIRAYLSTPLQMNSIFEL